MPEDKCRGLQPFTGEGISFIDIIVAPDGKHVVATGPDGKLMLYPVDGGTLRRILGKMPTERIARFSEISAANQPPLPARSDQRWPTRGIFQEGYTMDGLQIFTLLGGIVAGAAIPIFIFHYQRFWDTCRAGSESARRIHRGLQALRLSLATFESAAEGGRPSLYRKIAETSARTKAIFELGDSLFDLRDEGLERDVDQTFRGTRFFLARGVTDLMAETGSADDFRVPGTPGYEARQAYLREILSIHLPELDLVLRRTRPLTSPWGFWWRSFTTIPRRVHNYAAGSRLQVELERRHK